MMFYNLENLFLPDFFNSKGKSGLKKWTKDRYENKLFKIAHVFELVKQSYGSLPILIGVSEVSDRKALDDLLDKEVFQGKYGYVHFNSLDERGVDVALLYDKEKIEILYSEPLTYLFEIEDENPDNYDTTRDVLYCKVRCDNHVINLFTLHLPSKREKNINANKRRYILESISEKAKFIIDNEKDAVFILGDFNDNPNEPMIEDFVRKTQLNNPFYLKHKSREYTTFYKRFGLTFDQIIFSNNLYSNRIEVQDSMVFNHDEIRNYDKRFKGRPFRTYVGTRYLGGYSDHFPVLIRMNFFEKKNRE